MNLRLNAVVSTIMKELLSGFPETQAMRVRGGYDMNREAVSVIQCFLEHLEHIRRYLGEVGQVNAAGK